ncbi:multicopper oxidase family protein [Rubellicoccus peritrichatus]|uniref:Multicopper oxidase family protein n=1 Tax=Rubellicoccus peritrichatus TaxID=3080537 RepID=A0AAQ3LAY0_9BACT|nr:multicopper oxidase family protein [Puniceicoccus sp. CR14]WOO40153.1 multicopper oxidase family protein [Puniceicoccus sp. CR14]
MNKLILKAKKFSLIPILLVHAFVYCITIQTLQADDSITVFIDSFEDLEQPVEFRSANGLLEVTHILEEASNFLGDGTSDDESEYMFIFGPTYNGSIPGPTLRVKPGDNLVVHTVNNLPPNDDNFLELLGIDLEFCTPLELQKIADGDIATLAAKTTTDFDFNFPHELNSYNLHTHGLHVSPAHKADEILRIIKPGSTYTNIISIPEDHVPGVFFYHPHNHGSIWAQYRSGMAGTIIVEGDIDEVPEIAAAKDIVLVLQQLETDSDFGTGEPDSETSDFTEVFETVKVAKTVNGQLNPTIRIQPGEVQRWRIIHAGRDDNFPFECDGVDFYVIGYDGIPIEEPVLMEKIFLAPGNRVEVLAKGKDAGTYSLTKVADGNVDELTIATVVVEGATIDMGIPETLPYQYDLLAPIAAEEVTGTRSLEYEIVLQPDALDDHVINGNKFDPTRVDQTIYLDDVDEWTITGDGHPHHIHSNDFYVVELEGTYLSDSNGENGIDATELYPTMPLWMDTIMVPSDGKVVLRSRYERYTGALVLHCHIIHHEELGMMQLVEILPPMGEYYLGVERADTSDDDYISQWLGAFNVSDLPWLWHYQFGWLYPAGTGAVDDDFWLYAESLDLAWLWTNSLSFPALWSNDRSSWLFYLDGDGTNFFYDLSQNEWFEASVSNSNAVASL